MIRVGVNGYGTIGKRVADAVDAQPDMEVIGVAKPSRTSRPHRRRPRVRLYAADGREPFDEADLGTAGTVHDLIETSDVVVVSTRSGVGAADASLSPYMHASSSR